MSYSSSFRPIEWGFAPNDTLVPLIFILAEIAITMQISDNGLGKYSEPHSEPPASASHHKTIAHRIRLPAMMFCAIYSAFSEREKVAIKVKDKFNKVYNNKIETNISPIKNYCKAEEYHQRYIEKSRQ